ncbi:MAG TPA: transposase [Polyangiaceae bacterium]|nr:transposase [Polyangiaceae bacterium]
MRALWEETFRRGLTAPGFANFLVIASGWLLTEGTHAVTEALVMTDVAARRHHEGFHRFFSRGTWSPDLLGRWIFGRIRNSLGDVGVVRIVLDDTLAPKKGPHVFGIGSHLDAVRSTKKQKVFAFGHCWVTLAVLVRVPFSSRTWALPVLFRLYRTQKDCERRGVPHRKKTALARDMLDVLSSWTADLRIELAADSAYCNDTVTRDLPEQVVLFGAMRPDAVLTELPPNPTRSARGGRPRKRGRLLRKPEQIASDGRTPWKTTQAMLYGRKTTVRFKTFCAQWYRATGTRLLRIVVVATDSGSMPYRVFFSFDSTLEPSVILESYAARWGIEVFFREAKQLLGFADSRARKEAAVLRVAPLVGLLYSSLVVWFAEGIHHTTIAAPPIRPWYSHKHGLCFNDVLRAARRALDGAEVLDPRRVSNNLQELSSASRRAERRRLDKAA